MTRVFFLESFNKIAEAVEHTRKIVDLLRDLSLRFGGFSHIFDGFLSPAHGYISKCHQPRNARSDSDYFGHDFVESEVTRWTKLWRNSWFT